MHMEKMAKGLALTAVLGGIARIGMTPSAIIWGVDSVPELVFGIVACLLMGTGIFGLYMYEANRLGTIGFVSVLLIAFSSTLTSGLAWSAMLGVTYEDHSYVGTMQAINSLTALVGMIGFCVMTLRARIFPVWAVVLFLLFPVMSFIPAVQDYATVAWGLSYIGFGYYVLAGKTVRNSASFHAEA